LVGLALYGWQWTDLLGLAIVDLAWLCYLWLGLALLWSAMVGLAWLPYGRQ
jgi:hypothetical protein